MKDRCCKHGFMRRIIFPVAPEVGRDGDAGCEAPESAGGGKRQAQEDADRSDAARRRAEGRCVGKFQARSCDVTPS